MKNLLKPLKPYIFYIVLIVAMLVVQAYCDLTLPTYTSEIIDTGIQNSGFEHILPEKINSDEFETMQAFMTDEEKEDLKVIYSKDSDSKYVLDTDLKEKKLDDLDNEFMTSILLNYSLSHEEVETFKKSLKEQLGAKSPLDVDNMTIEEIGKAMGATLEVHTEDTDDGKKQYVDTRPLIINLLKSGQYTQDNIDSIRDKINDEIDTAGSSMLKSMGIAYAKQTSESAGIDIDKHQNNYLWMTGGKMLLLTVILVTCSITAAFFSSRVGSAVGRDLRSNVFGNVMKFSNNEINKFSTASLITRSTNDIQQIQFVIIMLLRMVAYAPIMAIGGIIKVANTRSGMGWTVALAVAVLLVIIIVLMSATLPRFKIMQKLVDRMNLVSREMLTGLQVIRAFGREKKEEEIFEKANKDLTNNQLFVNRAMTCMMPAMQMVMYGLQILIVWIAAHKINDGVLEVGSMTAFIQYAIQIVFSFLIISMLAVFIPRATVAADRIQEVINTNTTIENPDNGKDIKSGTVEFKNVSFKYEGAERNAIENISFKAEPGKTTAIIGSTGSGKSTLVNMIPRLYDVTDGEVTIGGENVKNIDLSKLRRSIGFVPQKGILFSGTIADNIKFGDDNISQEKVERAAKISQSTEFIETKPQRYNSFIAQGGSNVSGGQKQRLSIARAIAKDPKVYVFDDSFSALDMKTDSILRKELAKVTENAAVIIVAQRISTIMNADQIIVLDDGKIVGQGTHKELLKNCEQYLQIAKSQLSEKELEGGAN